MIEQTIKQKEKGSRKDTCYNEGIIKNPGIKVISANGIAPTAYSADTNKKQTKTLISLLLG